MAKDNIIQFTNDSAVLEKYRKKNKFEELKKYIGEDVTINTAEKRGTRILTAKLIDIDNEYVYTDVEAIPFIASDVGIVNILSKDKKSIYSNPIVECKYFLRIPSQQDIREAKIYIYGKIKTDIDEEKMRKIKEEANRIIKERLEESESKKYKLMKEGIDLVKPELLEEWFDFVDKNTKNGWAFSIEAMIFIMKGLEEKADCREVEKIAFDKYGIDGNTIYLLRPCIVKYYKNGEIYQNYMNKLEEELQKKLEKYDFFKEK